jgi:hypothetical protein
LRSISIDFFESFLRIWNKTESHHRPTLRLIKKRASCPESIKSLDCEASQKKNQQVLALVAQLSEPELSVENRLKPAAQIRLVLLGEQMALPMFLLRSKGFKANLVLGYTCTFPG